MLSFRFTFFGNFTIHFVDTCTGCKDKCQIQGRINGESGVRRERTECKSKTHYITVLHLLLSIQWIKFLTYDQIVVVRKKKCKHVSNSKSIDNLRNTCGGTAQTYTHNETNTLNDAIEPKAHSKQALHSRLRNVGWLKNGNRKREREKLSCNSIMHEYNDTC